jgi:hypothetical protein
MAILFALLINCVPAGASTASTFVYHDGALLDKVRAEIAAGNPYFVQQRARLLAECDALLTVPADPVVNKTRMPPSGDKHDYLSLAPYAWPDPAKPDGMPWKAIDGVINPASRGPDTDFTRYYAFIGAVENLSFAYFYSSDQRYADKGIELLRIWLADAATKVNPHLNSGQSFPGVATGRPAGIIDWARMVHVITAVQIYDQGGVLPASLKTEIQAWLTAYLDWLLTNRLGKEADALPQNHANWYNYQVVGLMVYLGRVDAARARIEDAKISRIAAQIDPDGRQPRETGRTRSMHYSCMNVWALANLTFMGRQLGIDLWTFQTADGRSIPQAYRFLLPFALEKKIWPYRQLDGGASEIIRKELQPLVVKTASLLGVDFDGADATVNFSAHLSPLDALRYPPRDQLDRPRPAGVPAHNPAR